MLFSEADITQYRLMYTADYSISVQFWEDDDAGCAIRGHSQSAMLEMYNDLRGAYNVATAIINVTQVAGLAYFSWAASVANAYNALVTGEDRLLGTTLPQNLVGYNYSDATHILFRPKMVLNVSLGETEENGRVALELRNP